jgi:hypothetical protein
MLATINRWIVSSINTRLRNLSSMKNTIRCILIIIAFSMMIHFQVIYCFETDIESGPQSCFNKDEACRLIADLMFAIITILIPLIFILIFGLLTISNIRSSKSRIDPTGMSIISRPSNVIEHSHYRRNQQNQKRDHSLLIMLFIQIILLAFLTLPFAIQRFYSTITMNDEKSRLQRSIERFIYQITLLMTFAATGIQFYVNTFSGGYVFRTALFNFFRWIIQKLMRRSIRIKKLF